MLHRHLLALLAPLATAWTTALVAQAPGRVLPYPIDLPEPFVAAVQKGTRTLTGRPGPNHWTNTAHYELRATLDPVAARLTGRAVMTYHNRSPERLDQLVVHLYQDLMKGGAQRTRTVVPTPGLELGALQLDGAPVRGTVRDTRLYVRLPQGLAPGAKTTLTVDYAFAVPKAGTAPRMGHDGDAVFYLGYWYPQFAVYDDVLGWVADPHRGNGEFYMGYADYDLFVTAPVGYLVRATGELQNPDAVLTEKARQALAEAARSHDIVHVVDKDDLAAGRATATDPSGALTWHFRAANVRDAAVSVAKSYLWDATHAVVADKEGPGKSGTCMIHAVYRPNTGDWVRAAKYAQHTIEYMSRMVHPYPWPHMTACEGIIGGGMEYPMMTICGGRQPAGVIAHELIHMWFPMLVGNNEKRYAWQDEGFTSFWTTLCRDDFTGGSNGPKRDIAGYANTVRRGADVSCMRHADAYGEDNFQFAAYGKPAAMLHQLRALLGDATFFAAFRRYAADWAYKHPYPYDFFRSFADAAGTDLESYFRTWCFETWQLDHAVGAVAERDGQTQVTIEDRGRAMHPAEVEATYADGRTERRIVPVDLWRTAVSAVVTFGPGVVKVEIDPEQGSLDVQRQNNVWQK